MPACYEHGAQSPPTVSSGSQRRAAVLHRQATGPWFVVRTLVRILSRVSFRCAASCALRAWSTVAPDCVVRITAAGRCAPSASYGPLVCSAHLGAHPLARVLPMRSKLRATSMEHSRPRLCRPGHSGGPLCSIVSMKHGAQPTLGWAPTVGGLPTALRRMEGLHPVIPGVLEPPRSTGHALEGVATGI